MSKVCLLTILCFIGLAPCWSQSSVESVNGILDARSLDLNQKDQTIQLDGKWEFFWEKLLTPNDFAKEPARTSYIEVPSIWNNQSFNGEFTDGQGFATYRLKVLLDKAPDLLSIEIPNFYTSYALFINGSKVSANGQVGTSKTSVVPQWKPTLKVFEATDTIDIVLQVANFHHKRGGIHKSIILGNFDNISSIREQRVVANMILTGGLFALGLFFIVFYILKINEWASLYFGLFCLFWALRSVFSNIYLVSSFFENLNWSFALRVEYLSLYISVLFGTLFMSKAFDNSESQLLKYVISIVSLLFIAFTVMLPPVLFTKLLPAYQIFIAINLIFAVYVITKALFKNQPEAWFSAISLLLGVSLFGYEMINYVLVTKINFVFLNLAYLTVFFLNSLVLAYRFVGAYRKVPNTNSEQPLLWTRGR